MVSLTIELITWGIYFSVGFLLLIILLFARRTYQKIDARQRKADKIVERFNIKTKGRTDVYRGTYYK